MQAASKKRDDIKVTKAREQMEESRRLYEVLNKELHEELPALYDSRIPFFVNTFQTMFSSEATFHAEYAKVYAQFTELIEALAAEAAKGTYQTDAHRYVLPAGGGSPYAMKLDEDGQPIPPGYGDGSNSPQLSSPANNNQQNMMNYNNEEEGENNHMSLEEGDHQPQIQATKRQQNNTAVITTTNGDNSNTAAQGNDSVSLTLFLLAKKHLLTEHFVYTEPQERSWKEVWWAVRNSSRCNHKGPSIWSPLQGLLSRVWMN